LKAQAKKLGPGVAVIDIVEKHQGDRNVVKDNDHWEQRDFGIVLKEIIVFCVVDSYHYIRRIESGFIM
jgi:hypothetical protein